LFAGAGHWSNATAFAFGQEGRFFVDPSQYVPVPVLICACPCFGGPCFVVFPDLSKRMTPDQAIRAVTIDAALSARMANKIGSS
jgi:hypothetical protein